MLAKSVHLPGSRFRRIPNPCADAWTPRLNMVACLNAFAGSLRLRPGLGNHTLTRELHGLFEHGRIDAYTLTRGQSLEQKIRAYSDAASRYADLKTGRLYYENEEDRKTDVDEAGKIFDELLLDLLDALHWAMERVDERFREMVKTPEFSDVVSSHLAAVLDQEAELNAELSNASAAHPKERILINFYFNNIYPAVVPGSEEATDDDQTADSVTLHSTSASIEPALSPQMIEERSAIWLGLMFRMWSWLFLHDFNPEDRMIERSEVQNSRLPVYIG